jgi:hypothetical protein
LRCVGQGRQLPSRGDCGAVDWRPRVDGRRGVVCAPRMADTRRAATRAHSRGDSISGKVAIGAHVACARFARPAFR